MKFKKYINEVSNDETIKSIINEIEHNCKPFIKDWKKLNTSKWLMSGRNKETDSIDKKQVRKDRTPRDTPEDMHEFLDDWFYKKFGVRSRSNAIFCTFNPDIADYYGNGNLSLIFPIGKYKAVSSDKIGDVYNILDEIFSDLTSSLISRRSYATATDDEIKKVKRKLITAFNKAKYTDKLKTFHNNEIMVTCKEYYIVNGRYNGQLLDYFGR